LLTAHVLPVVATPMPGEQGGAARAGAEVSAQEAWRSRRLRLWSSKHGSPRTNWAGAGVGAGVAAKTDSGPRWTFDPTFEQPAGIEDMGTWKRTFYTPEQQQRLGVDDDGNERAPPGQLEQAPRPDVVQDIGADAAEPGVSAGVHFDFFVVGNLDRHTARYMHDDVVSCVFSPADIAAGNGAVRTQAHVHLEGRWLAHRLEHPNPSQTQSAVELFVQLGRKDQLGFHTDAAAIVLSSAISGLFFADLRTSQQLGYVVQSKLKTSFHVREIAFLVQGTAATPDAVSDSILTFVGDIPQKLANISDAEFANYVASLHQQLLERPPSVEDPDSGLGSQIFGEIEQNCTSDFHYNEKLAAALLAITKDDVQALGNAIVDSNGPYGRLLVQVWGRAQAPMPEPMSLQEGFEAIGDLAKFRSSAKYTNCEGEHAFSAGSDGLLKRDQKVSALSSAHSRHASR